MIFPVFTLFTYLSLHWNYLDIYSFDLIHQCMDVDFNSMNLSLWFPYIYLSEVCLASDWVD